MLHAGRTEINGVVFFVANTLIHDTSNALLMVREHDEQTSPADIPEEVERFGDWGGGSK